MSVCLHILTGPLRSSLILCLSVCYFVCQFFDGLSLVSHFGLNFLFDVYFHLFVSYRSLPQSFWFAAWQFVVCSLLVYLTFFMLVVYSQIWKWSRDLTKGELFSQVGSFPGRRALFALNLAARGGLA